MLATDSLTDLLKLEYIDPCWLELKLTLMHMLGNMQNVQKYAKYAIYAKYVEYAEIAEYAKYAEYAEYAKYAGIVRSVVPLAMFFFLF